MNKLFIYGLISSSILATPPLKKLHNKAQQVVHQTAQKVSYHLPSLNLTDHNFTQTPRPNYDQVTEMPTMHSTETPVLSPTENQTAETCLLGTQIPTVVYPQYRAPYPTRTQAIPARTEPEIILTENQQLRDTLTGYHVLTTTLLTGVLLWKYLKHLWPKKPRTLVLVEEITETITVVETVPVVEAVTINQ